MSALQKTCVTKSQIRVRATIKLITLILCLGITRCPALRAQVSEGAGPNLKGVTDVTGGMHYLLQNDDMVMLQVNQDNNGMITTSLVTFDTSDSKLPDTPTKTTIVSSFQSNGSFNPGALGSKLSPFLGF